MTKEKITVANGLEFRAKHIVYCNAGSSIPGAKTVLPSHNLKLTEVISMTFKVYKPDTSKENDVRNEQFPTVFLDSSSSSYTN